MGIKGHDTAGMRSKDSRDVSEQSQRSALLSVLGADGQAGRKPEVDFGASSVVLYLCLFVCFCVFDRASLNSELLNLYRQTDLQATDI